MCGIAGIVSKNRQVNIEVLQSMSKVLAHRGPDGEGYYINDAGNVGFMHRRLSIIDLSNNGSQPMKSTDNRYLIIFNGEIYNYLEIKEDLINSGHEFRSTSDTEVLLALYIEKGENCLEFLDGMFAFAIWDNLEEVLFLARDRFGEKPLYYCFHEDSFYFASEMKALFAIGIPKVISENSVFNYLNSGNLLNPLDPGETFYRNIRQLDAAHYMLIFKGQVKILKRYWDLDGILMNGKIGFEEAKEKFLELFTHSVKLRLRSDVPIGSSLSGGIDSSAIVLLANKLTDSNQIQNTFSARFDNFYRDEGAYMGMVIKKGKELNPHYVWPDVYQMIEELETLAYHQEEPFASGSIYAQFCVMRLAKTKNTTVLLDGQGADEQMGGYLHYYAYYLTSLITKNPIAFFKERSAYQKVHRDLMPYRIPRRLPLWILRNKLLGEEYRYDKGIKSILRNDTTVNGLKTLLRYADRNSMAFSREVRLPFLSHELVEFIFTLPVEFILHDGWTKYILRESMGEIVPSEILWRKDKIGYEPPQNDWMKVIQPEIDDFKSKNNYLEFTGGRRVDNIDNWKWLMLKIFSK